MTEHAFWDTIFRAAIGRYTLSVEHEAAAFARGDTRVDSVDLAAEYVLPLEATLLDDWVSGAFSVQLDDETVLIERPDTLHVLTPEGIPVESACLDAGSTVQVAGEWRESSRFFPEFLGVSWCPSCLRGFFRRAIICFLLIAGLTACTDTPQRLWLKAPGWSRAQLIGTTALSDPVPIAVDDAGHSYVLLLQRGGDAPHLRIVVLDQRATIAWDRTYDVPVPRPGRLALVWDGMQLQMFWVDAGRLYTARVQPADGALLTSPVLLSGQSPVATYDVAHDADGTLTVWYAGDRQNLGLYAVPPGKAMGEGTARLVDPEGVRPDIQYDDDGVLHAAWAQYRPNGMQFFHATYAGGTYGTYQPGRATSVAQPNVSFTSILKGPRLGLDRQYAYVFWSVVLQSGLEAGTIENSYVVLADDASEVAPSVHHLRVPYNDELPYQSVADTALEAGPRVPITVGAGTTTIVDLVANTATVPELAVAFRVKFPYLLNKQEWQVGIAFFRDGTPTGYQLLSYTPSGSDSPNLISSDAGYLYAVWREGVEDAGFPVYFASTAPTIRASLSGVTGDDVIRMAGETLFSLAAGALLAPFAIAWSILPLIVLGLTTLIRREDDRLTDPGTMVSLGLVLASYWVSKVFFLPGIVEHVPFVAWIPIIPAWLGTILRLVVPLIIAGTGVAVAWHNTYRKDNPSILPFLLIYVAVDAVLTMAIYGGLILGAF